MEEKIEFREKRSSQMWEKGGKGWGAGGEDLKSIHLSFELPGFVSASHNGNVQ